MHDKPERCPILDSWCDESNKIYTNKKKEKTMPTPEFDTVELETAAAAAHEANRAFCRALGDYSHEHWENAPEEQRRSCKLGVIGVLQFDHTPEQSHAAWVNHKIAEGWRYAAVKDAAKKEHPCLVAYSELPEEQRIKDELFHAVVKATARAVWKRPQ